MHLLKTAVTCAVFSASIAVAQTQQYLQTNLTSSSSAAAAAATIDPNLNGAWGLSESSTGPWWVTDVATGFSTLYNGAGATQKLVVSVPTANPALSKTGTPTGMVFNSNPNLFLLPDGQASNFLFVTLDGLVAGWNGAVPNSTAQVVVNQASTASFTGLATAQATVNGMKATYLYVADFKGAKVRVFDSSFKPAMAIENAIAALGMPPGSAPFGIQNIGGNLYVTLARADNTTGPGQGAVAVITPEGHAIGVLQGGTHLDAPWGVALAPGNFGDYSHDLLVGNNGDGKINVFNPITGAYIATLGDKNNNPIAIPGLWGLSFGNGTVNGGSATTLFFAADLNGAGGLFGSITPVQNGNGSNN